MTTQPAPVPKGYISPDSLPPEDRAYGERLKRALRCGVPGCSCANPARFHCPSHDNAAVPTLTVSYNPDPLPLHQSPGRPRQTRTHAGIASLHR